MRDNLIGMASVIFGAMPAQPAVARSGAQSVPPVVPSDEHAALMKNGLSHGANGTTKDGHARGAEPPAASAAWAALAICDRPA